MEAAYVLIQCDLGAEAEIISKLAAIPRGARGARNVRDYTTCSARSRPTRARRSTRSWQAGCEG